MHILDVINQKVGTQEAMKGVSSHSRSIINPWVDRLSQWSNTTQPKKKKKMNTTLIILNFI